MRVSLILRTRIQKPTIIINNINLTIIISSTITINMFKNNIKDKLMFEPSSTTTLEVQKVNWSRITEIMEVIEVKQSLEKTLVPIIDPTVILIT